MTAGSASPPLTTARRALFIPILVIIIAVAAYFRCVGLDWDEGYHLHPDERFLAMVASNLAPVDSFGAYLDTPHSTLNPNNRGFGFFVYGTFPVIAARWLGDWFAAPGNDWDQRLFGRELSAEYARVRLIGRVLSVLCDLLATVLVFAIGARLYGGTVGLLASALYAGAVLPIQQAHFFTVDAIANLFVVLALWLAVRATDRARWSDDILFGVALGAGLACKVSIGPAALLLVLGLVARYGVQQAALNREERLDVEERRRRRAAVLVRSAISLNVVFILTVLSFRILQPYAFLPARAGDGPRSGTDVFLDLSMPRLNPSWMEQMAKVRQTQSGADDSPPNHQWATRAALAFPWLNMVRFGLGWPLGLVAWLGWAWAAVEALRGRAQSWRHVLPVAWIGLYFAWYGAGWVTTMRYFLPIYPALALTAAWALVRIAMPEHDASVPAAPPPPLWRRVAGMAAIVVVLGCTWAWAFAFTRIYARPHPRLAASRWIYTHIPADVTLTLERPSGTTTRQIGLPNKWMPADNKKDDPAAPAVALTLVAPEEPLVIRFTLPEAGRLSSLRMNDVRPADADGTDRRVEVEIAELDDTTLAKCVFAEVDASTTRDRSLSCDVPSVQLAADREYQLRIRAFGGSVLSAGATLGNEGRWDDAVPIPLPHQHPWDADYQGYGLEMAWEDEQTKRTRMQHVLDRIDYLVISSNRFYGSLTRNPRRWPMSIEYYRALFSGNLGFELIADFASYPSLGDFWVDDQSAEEAFTVYDHPRVLIFRKTDAYDPAKTAKILKSAPLDRVWRRPAIQVGEPPAELPLPRPLTPPASSPAAGY